MKDSKQVIDQVAQEMRHSQPDSPIAAGPTEANAAGQGNRPKPPPALIDAINQVFSLFSLNFHNQYYAAYKDTEREIQAKRLWLEALRGFEPAILLQAAKSVMVHNEYLPTLHTMLEHCQKQLGEALPDAHAAYVEACRAPNPKASARWSHRAVYHAGRLADWYFLATTSEATAFPIFRRHYNEICQRVRDGEQLSEPNYLALPEETETGLSKADNLEKLKQLRQDLDL